MGITASTCTAASARWRPGWPPATSPRTHRDPCWCWRAGPSPARSGGASGALYGRALLRAGAALEALPGGSVANSAQLAAVLRAAVDGVAALGRSRPGEKTMLDALVPAVVAFEAAGAAGVDVASAMRRAADAAEVGARGTLPLLATKGRASYLGERSIGHLDPGAVSSALLLRALADVAASGA